MFGRLSSTLLCEYFKYMSTAAFNKAYVVKDVDDYYCFKLSSAVIGHTRGQNICHCFSNDHQRNLNDRHKLLKDKTFPVLKKSEQRPEMMISHGQTIGNIMWR